MPIKLVEIIGLPEQKREGRNDSYKVIQMYLNKSPILLIEQPNQRQHQDILRNFLDERKIKYTKSAANRQDLAKPTPDKTGINYEVTGAGIILLTPDNKAFWGFGGRSITYNLEIDPEHAKLSKQALKDLGWNVSYKL